jgi:nucleoside-diphosphate-sugar epimerase
MRYNVYSRTNQQLLDAVVIGVSFYLAFLIRYAGAVPGYDGYQFRLLLVPLVVGRLLANYLCGLNRVQWRYIGVADTIATARSFAAFSCFLLLLRVILPASSLFRIPGTIITIELLLSLVGALSVRIVRRYVYESRNRTATVGQTNGSRRLLLIGAGMMGAKAAKGLAAEPSIRIVGFLDDDPQKAGSVIAGAKVLGTTSHLVEVIRREEVDSVLVCIAPAARSSFNRLVALLDDLPVTSKFVPTISEILDSKDGLHLAVSQSGIGNGTGKGHAAQWQQQVTIPLRSGELKNKCVLITGGAGFIGSTLAERIAKDNRVLLVDRFFDNQPVAFTPLNKHPNVEMIEADILEGSIVNDLAMEADIVIHAAAIVGVGRVCTYPRETLETNFIGTSRILKALERNSHLERFVYFSTSEVFGVNSFRVHEDTPTAVGSAAEARWSYAIAKLAGEHLVKAYHRQAGMPVVTVRPFNVFGPRRLGAHAILGFVLNALTGNPLEIHGDGSQIRSWCYIEDFCDAVMEMIVRPGAVGEDFNIGNPRNTLTILQLAEEVLRATNSAAPITFVKAPCPDIEIRVPSLEKAQNVLAYQPRYDLRRALQLTSDWYRQHMSCFQSNSLSARMPSSTIESSRSTQSLPLPSPSHAASAD